MPGCPPDENRNENECKPLPADGQVISLGSIDKYFQMFQSGLTVEEIEHSLKTWLRSQLTSEDKILAKEIAVALKEIDDRRWATDPLCIGLRLKPARRFGADKLFRLAAWLQQLGMIIDGDF
ncbi:MAG: hypothetical protein AAF810_05435 [Cyanobacteria bacterium P01_D01_bin.36]